MSEWKINSFTVWVNHLIVFEPNPLNSSANVDASLSVSLAKRFFVSCKTPVSAARVHVYEPYVVIGIASLCQLFESDVFVDYSEFSWQFPPLKLIWNLIFRFGFEYILTCSVFQRWISIQKFFCLFSERSWFPVWLFKSWDACRE